MLAFINFAWLRLYTLSVLYTSNFLLVFHLRRHLVAMLEFGVLENFLKNKSVRVRFWPGDDFISWLRCEIR